MNSDKSGNDKSVLHRAILPVPAIKSNSYKISENGEKPLYQDRGKYTNDVSRATECGFQDLTPIVKGAYQDCKQNYIPLIDGLSCPPEYHGFDSHDDDSGGGFCPEEYEQWANAETNGNLYGEVNAPRGSADNTTNAANQTTYEEGYEMLDYNTSAPARGVPPTLKNHSAFQSDDVIHVDSRYMLEPLEAAHQNGKYRIASKGDMKTGKTHATAMFIKDQPANTVTIIVIASQVLCQSTAQRLAEKSGKHVVDYQNLNASVRPDAVVTTYNSLPITERKLDTAPIHGLIFDESEQGAQFMARGTIDNKSEAAESIARIERKARFVWLLDAHLGSNSKHFTASFMPNAEFSLLLNHYQPWKEYTHSWHDGKKTGINLVSGLLESRKKIWIAATSAELAEKLHIALANTGKLDGLRVLAAYPDKVGDESEELKGAKNDNQKFKNYDVVFTSPAGGVGLSVEGEHFHRTVVFMVQDKRTPDAVSSVQYPFRARDLIEKHIDLVHIDQSAHGSPESKFENMRSAKILISLKNDIINSAATDKEKANMLKTISTLHIDYELKIDNQTAEDFPKYRQIISDEFKAKGITHVEAYQAPEAPEVQDAIKEAPAIIEAKRSAALISAPMIDEEEAERISGLSRRGRGLVSGTEQLSLKKHRLLRSYHFDDTTPTESQLHDYLALQKEGIATGRNNIARALLSHADVKRIQMAYVAGAGEDQLFKRDIASNKSLKIKALWQVDKILCALVGAVREIDTFRIEAPELITLEMLKEKGGVNKATSVLSALSAVADEYNAMKPEKRISRHKLNKEPLEEVRGLIASRLKVSTTKVRGEDAFTVDQVQPAIDNLNAQLARGSFGDLKVLDRIHAIEILIDGESLSEEARANLGITLENEQFLKRGLSMLSRRKQNAVLPEYLRRAALPKKSGDNFSPLARANHYLLDVCGVSELAA